MMQSTRQHHLFLSSEDSKNIFPGNHSTDFTVELPETLLLSGVWECALLEIFFTKKLDEGVVVLCDLCENSYISNTRLPVLRVLQGGLNKTNSAFVNINSISIPHNEVRRLRVYIRTYTGAQPSFVSGEVRCTLQIKRIL